MIEISEIEVAGKKIFPLLFSLGLIILFLSSVFFVFNLISKFSEKIISPVPAHYESDVFKVPDWLEAPRGASTSAITTNEPMIKLPIIMYHYVEYVKDGNDHIRKSLTINPYIFENQLIKLKESGYGTYFVKEIPEIFAKKIEYSPRSIVLTFDDGYEDFYTDVFPLLEKYRIKATLYVIANYIGRYGFLTKNQLKEIIASGLVEIGAHTLDHAYLKYISTIYAQEQILESKKALEEMLGIEVKTFAYPYGAFGRETLELVKEASFSAAVSVINGSHHMPSNLFYLPRIRAGMIASDNPIRTLESLEK